MSNERLPETRRLCQIADVLGIPVDRLLSDDGDPGDIFGARECLRLWFAIRSDGGRERALDLLRRLGDGEQP